MYIKIKFNKNFIKTNEIAKNKQKYCRKQTDLYKFMWYD